MTDVNAVVRAYGAAWLEDDEMERRRFLNSLGADEVYQDPTADVSGREASSPHRKLSKAFARYNNCVC